MIIIRPDGRICYYDGIMGLTNPIEIIIIGKIGGYMSTDKKVIFPLFKEPTTLEEAAQWINELSKDSTEHSYMIGKTLQWVNNEITRGLFEEWVINNIWISPKAAKKLISSSIEHNILKKLRHFIDEIKTEEED